MSRAGTRWVACLSVLMIASLAPAATKEVNLLLLRGKSVGMPGDDVRRICGDESTFEVYSPGLVVHTMKAEEMTDPSAALRKVFGQGESRVVFEHALACGRCPEGAASGASVSTALDGRTYVLGVLFPGKGEEPDVYRVRIQEMQTARGGEKKGGSMGGVIPPTFLSVPVRCPPGHVGVVGFSDFNGAPLFLVLKPRETKDGK